MAKRVTKTTAKKAVRTHCAALPEGCSVEVNSETVTVWYDASSYDVALAAARAVAKDLNAPSIRGNGSKWDVYYKRAAVDMGDYNDPSSRWHY